MLKSMLKNKSIFVIIVAVSLVAGMGYQYSSNASKSSKPDVIKIDSIVAGMTKEDLTRNSTLVIQGTVLKFEVAKWNTTDGKAPSKVSSNDIIYTDVTIEVDKVFKGNEPNKFITVRLYGGEVPISESIRQVINESDPEFTANEKVILFLTNDVSPFNKEESKDFYVTTGKFQGKYSIINDEVISKVDKAKTNDLLQVIENNKNMAPVVYSKPAQNNE